MPQDKNKLQQAPRKPKRDWVTPRLTEHGSLKQITAKIGATPDAVGGGSFTGK
jgi:hypothetical protein